MPQKPQERKDQPRNPSQKPNQTQEQQKQWSPDQKKNPNRK